MLKGSLSYLQSVYDYVEFFTSANYILTLLALVNPKRNICQAWWHTSVIPALQRLREKDIKF
jgi:hypothetical protein